MTDGRARFLEWCEKVQDGVSLYEDAMTDAMVQAERKDIETTAEESQRMGVGDFASR